MSQPRAALAGLFVVLSVAASIALARSGAGDRAPGVEERAPEPPRAAPSSERPAAPREGALGVVLARSSADIAPRFEGKLAAVHVRLGDAVPENGLIATLDVPSLRYDISMADAALKAALVDEEKAAVELAQAEEHLARRKALSAASLASAEDLSTAAYQLKLASSRVAAARAQASERRARLGQLQKNNADAEIRAPFAGIVAARYVDPGANVTPATPIVRLIGGDLFVRFAVPHEEAAGIAAGAKVRIVAGEAALRGSVDKVAPEIDAASRMIVVEALIHPEGAGGAPVRSGEMVRVFAEEAR